jgi:hypothetical protein
MPPTSCWPLLLPGLPVPVGTATKQHNSRAGAAMSMCYLGCTYAHASCSYLDCAGALRCMPCTVAAAAHAMPCGRLCLTHTRVLKFLPDHARARQQQQQCVILADCDTCTASTSPPPHLLLLCLLLPPCKLWVCEALEQDGHLGATVNGVQGVLP